jgi:Cytosine/uracil/thiamine/allantoin permeases
MFEWLGRFWTTLIVSVAGVALCGVPDVLNFFRYVSLFGNVFSPVAGVLVFDYLFVRRMQIDVAALYDPKGRYRYWAWLQSDRGCLDGDRLPDLHLRHPDRMDPSLADAADHGCRLPADRLDHAARATRLRPWRNDLHASLK